MVASRGDNGSQHDIHGISYRRGAAGERRQTTMGGGRFGIRLSASINQSRFNLADMTLHLDDLRGVAAHMAGAAR